MRQIETMTAHAPHMVRGDFPSKTEYCRNMEGVLGYDMGQSASYSFVECSGGDVARSFHGRPMASDNPKLAASDWVQPE
ncbi:MAG: hypothetical protein GXP55_01620 [Deltaproteobacteria bacterium]|nr:hypothetical protein [Deltaproteobacteria bacterium]